MSSVAASLLEFCERQSASIELGVVVMKPCGLVTQTRFRRSSLDLSVGSVASVVTREIQPFLFKKLSFGNRLSHGFCYRVSKDLYLSELILWSVGTCVAWLDSFAYDETIRLVHEAIHATEGSLREHRIICNACLGVHKFNEVCKGRNLSFRHFYIFYWLHGTTYPGAGKEARPPCSANYADD